MNRTTRVVGAIATAAVLAAVSAQAAQPATKTTKKKAVTTKAPVTTSVVTTAPVTTAPVTTSAPATTKAPVAGSAGDVCTKEREGGSIKINALAPQGAGMDTFSASSGGSMALGYEYLPFYSSLFRYDLATGDYLPLVAESATPNANASQWVVKLRPGVKFGSGNPLDADAFMAHLDRHLLKDSKSVIRGGNRSFITDWQKVDNLSVRFTLTRPWGSFPALLTVGLGMVQDVKVVNQVGQEAFSKFPKGGGVGPYEIEKWSPPEAVVLKAKENWWGGPVCIKNVTIVNIPLIDANYDAFQKNEVQITAIQRDAEGVAKALKDNPTRKITQFNNSSFMVLPNVGTGGYKGPMSDVRTRLAVAYAIDPDVINNRALGGKAPFGKGFINDKTNSLKPTKGLPYDPARARDLLNAVKAERNWDGTIGAICAGVPTSNKEACITVAALLTAVGFKVNLNAELSVGALVQQVFVTKNYEIVASWGIINDELNLWRGLNSWDTRNAGNLNGYDNQNFDALLDRMQAAANKDEYQKAVNDLQELVNKDVPFVTYGAQEDVTIWKEPVRGLQFTNTAPILDKAFLAK